MRLGIDGVAVFQSYFDYMKSQIKNALLGKNVDFSTNEVWVSPNTYTLKLEPRMKDAEFQDGKGIYILYRENIMKPEHDFFYVGSTIEGGHKQRCGKILKHGVGVEGKGDTCLPVSRFIRDNCDKNIDNIKTVFVPLDMSETEIRQMETAIIRDFKKKHGYKVKNVVTTVSSTRPAKKEPQPALVGLI